MAVKRKSSSPKDAATGSSSERKAPPTVKRAPARNTGSPPPLCSVHGTPWPCKGKHVSKGKG